MFTTIDAHGMKILSRFLIAYLLILKTFQFAMNVTMDLFGTQLRKFALLALISSKIALFAKLLKNGLMETLLPSNVLNALEILRSGT